jgi:hypothetical protein
LTAEERAAIAEGDAKVAEMQKAADESRAARRRANLEKIAAKSQQA